MSKGVGRPGIGRPGVGRPGASATLAGALAAVALHDLRNLLAVAETSAHLAHDNLDDRPFAARHLERVQQKIRAAQELLARSLAVASGQPLQRAEHSLAEVFRDACADLAVAPDVELRIDDGSKAVVARCERALLARAIANLVSNAMEAVASTDRPGIVQVEAERREGEVVIHVSDDGPGLPTEVAFANVTTKPTGSGLGMLIARAITEAHGGTLEVVERAPWSTTFELRIPG